ncbi:MULTISPECIES: hypothetical protein [Bacillus]|uniref:hypothetical protein n=1 Tax=Bacillus TaxID=1386 RepID=UPI0002E2C4A3|nr:MULTISPECIES: hypothetical protein [Bacillus]
MKKSMVCIGLLITVILLTSCNSTVNPVTSKEIDIINENLKLKDRVAELEHSLSTTEKKEEKEKHVEKVILSFFNNINNGEFAEARNAISGHVNITKTAIIIENGAKYDIDQFKRYSLQLVSSNWSTNDDSCLTFNLIGSKLNKKMNVKVKNINGEWKIDGFGIHYNT